jgi:hypothetical protein
MDSFERARLKYEKKRIQQGRDLPKAPETEAVIRPEDIVQRDIPDTVVYQTPAILQDKNPKKKTSNGVINISITIDGSEYEYSFTAPGMSGNLNANDKTKKGMEALLLSALSVRMGKIHGNNVS